MPEAAASATLQSLPGSIVSRICSHLTSSDHGRLRLVSRGLAHTVDQLQESVQVSCNIQQTATLLCKLKGLKALMFVSLGPAGTYQSHAELQSHVPDFVQSVSALTSLSSLTLSSAAAQQLGAIKWAHIESQSAVEGAQHDSNFGQPGGVSHPSALDQVYWVPDWLATAPKLQHLAIVGPGSSFSTPSSTPAWLWLHPRAWAHKLTHLQLSSIPLLPGIACLGISALTNLERLTLTGVSLRPTAVEQLLQQLGSCVQLTALVLSGNDMCLLPEHGWDKVTGLKELDVSRQSLLEPPAGLSHLTGLTALQVHHNSLTTLRKELTGLSNLLVLNASHNWLSGGGPHLPQLLEAWPHLAELYLDNVSDKRGELLLPPQLASCKNLVTLSIKDNFNINWMSLLAVLPSCKALKVLQLDKQTDSGHLRDLQAVLTPEVIVESK